MYDKHNNLVGLPTGCARGGVHAVAASSSNKNDNNKNKNASNGNNHHDSNDYNNNNHSSNNIWQKLTLGSNAFAPTRQRGVIYNIVPTICYNVTYYDIMHYIIT